MLIPSTLPFSELFTAHDNDGASGGVLLEQMFFDDCLVFDGLTYGNGDGLLSDESAVLDHPTLCEAVARCGLSGLDEPVVRVEATDCGNNVGVASRIIPVDPTFFPQVCQVDLSVAKSLGSAELTWEPVFRAESYDVIRGQLAQIRPAGDSVDLGPVTCLAEDTPGTASSDPEDPGPGSAFFYLVRYHHGLTTSEYGWSSSDEPERPGSGDCVP